MMAWASVLCAALAVAPRAEPQRAEAPAQEAPTTGSPSQEVDQPLERISGREHPELLPEEGVWYGFFAFVDSMGQGATDPDAQPVRELRLNIYVSRAESVVLVRIARQVRARLAELEQVDTLDIVASHPELDEEQAWRQQRQQLDNVVLAGRDELLRSLSSRGGKAVEHFLAAKLKPGMIAGVRP